MKFITLILASLVFLSPVSAFSQEELSQRINELQYKVDNIILSLLKDKEEGTADIYLPSVSNQAISSKSLITQIQSLKNLISDLTNRLELIEYKFQNLSNVNEDIDTQVFLTESIKNNVVETQVSLPDVEDESPFQEDDSSLNLQKQKLQNSRQTVNEIKLSMQNLYDQSLASLQNKDFSEAIKGFTFFMDKFKESPLASNALYWLAEIYYSQKNYTEAARLFLQNFNDYPKGAKTAPSLFKLGKTFQILGKKAAACTAYRKVSEYTSKQDSNVRTLASNQLKSLVC